LEEQKGRQASNRNKEGGRGSKSVSGEKKLKGELQGG